MSCGGGNTLTVYIFLWGIFILKGRSVFETKSMRSKVATKQRESMASIHVLTLENGCCVLSISSSLADCYNATTELCACRWSSTRMHAHIIIVHVQPQGLWRRLVHRLTFIVSGVVSRLHLALD